jgi:hypothetical protein
MGEKRKAAPEETRINAQQSGTGRVLFSIRDKPRARCVPMCPFGLG